MALGLPPAPDGYDLRDQAQFRRLVGDSIARLEAKGGVELPIIDMAASPYLLTEDTANCSEQLQAAIDSLPDTGGIILYPAGVYVHTATITSKAGVIVAGRGTGATELSFGHATNNFFEFSADPDGIQFRDLLLRQTNGSGTGFAITQTSGLCRMPMFVNIETAGFRKSIRLSGSIGGTMMNCRFNGQGKTTANGVGLELDAANGFSCHSTYVSNIKYGFDLSGAAIVLVQPILESCDVGVFNRSGTLVVVHPWATESTGANNTDFYLDAAACLLGYGSNSWNVQYFSSTVEDRTIIIPNSNDRLYNDSGNVGGPAGIKLGTFLIREDGHVRSDKPVVCDAGINTTAHTATGSISDANFTYAEGDTTSGGATITLTLPTITADMIGPLRTVKKIGGLDANIVGVAPAASDTIDGSAATVNVTKAGDSILLQAIALTKWRIVADRRL